jgi:hypothetical protein
VSGEASTTRESKSISISIERSWRDVYEAIWRPEAFPGWASGLSQSRLQKRGDEWTAEGLEGPIKIRFTERNAFGIMDHHVTLADGSVVYVPLRVVANGAGAEVIITIFREPGMSAEKFAADCAWVERDLLALKAHVLQTCAP